LLSDNRICLCGQLIQARKKCFKCGRQKVEFDFRGEKHLHQSRSCKVNLIRVIPSEFPILRITGGLFGLFMLGLIGFIIYFALNPKNRFTTAFDSWKQRKAVHAVGTILRAAFFICVLVMAAIGGIQYYFTESGWYPRTREFRYLPTLQNGFQAN
jgi:hypothetical protein